ncbi:MAG: branched-chain amino acid ABC transporter permease [Alphaproteobacteria bacterium]|nr:MAG: branched-chain amino acid ABC transporter permease [Alphaproteobacteria bacterium]
MAAAALGMAYFGSHGLLSLLAQAVIVSMLALGVGFLIRVSGLVSFGHAAPFGLGAYAAALALSPGSWLPPEIGLVLIVPTVTFLFFFVGLIASRLEGIAFAMLTLAVGQAIYVAATKFRDVTGGADGLIVELPRRLFGFGTEAIQQPAGMFLLTLALLGCVYALLRLFEFTRYGRLAVAIRENEERVRFLGYRTRALRAGVYAISAGIAALGGILFALYQGFVSPEIVHWTFSGSALIMAILGGTVSLWGPIAGAFVFFFVRDWLSDATTHWLAILGTALIVVTVLWPTGLSGGVYALWDGLAGKGRRGRSR